MMKIYRFRHVGTALAVGLILTLVGYDQFRSSHIAPQQESASHDTTVGQR